MSDTPKTDELAKREFITDGVWIRHARKLERENAELRATLELVMAADERAVDAWRAAHPGTALVRPDRAALVAWLLEQNAALRAHAERVGQANDRLAVETDALRAELDLWRDGNIIREEERNELIALRADKARLDWLEQARPIAWALGDAQRGEYWILTDLGEKHPEESKEFATLRAAIDAARKEAQP